MAHIVADRVKDTTTTTGTANITLAGAPGNTFFSFGSVMADGDTCQYCIAHQSANEVEIGIGTYVAATPALARTTVIRSSNSDAAVSFSAGTKDVLMVLPAAWTESGETALQSLTSNQNNFNPTGFANKANVICVSTDQARELTGLAGGYPGRRVLIKNADSAGGPLILVDLSGSSSSANQFALPRRRVHVWPGDVVSLLWHSQDQKWALISEEQPSSLSDDVIDLTEDFHAGAGGVTGATEAGEFYGVASWKCTGNGTPVNATIASEAKHPGIINLVTGGTSGNDTRLHLANAATDPVFRYQDIKYFSALVRTTDITSTQIKIGLGTDIGDTTIGGLGTSSAIFEFDSGTNANWRGVTRNASVSEVSTTSTVVSNNTWYYLEAYNSGSSWAFWINGTLQVTNSTTIPTGSTLCNLGASVETQTTAARNLHIDLLRFRTARLGQRY